MLFLDDATAIASVVSNDPEASKRISSYVSKVLPDSWGIAGSLRNTGYVLTNMATLGRYADPTDKATADRVCTGIADAASIAINKAIPKYTMLWRFVSSTTVSRVLHKTSHTATSVLMVDGQSHLFDWHATLSAQDPMLFKTVADWLVGKGGVTLKDFGGFM
jgi:hypothetical protein